MAHGWDSYFDNLPPLSSDQNTLRTESDESLSQQIENFTVHLDFPGPVASYDAPATNSTFNTNYYSNSSTATSSSDCVYQRYKDTPWQGEQMEKDYFPKYENGDISFATDELSTSENFPSSYAADVQGLKQDCGTLTTSFPENYSDVSSCSDADVSETRPSCKYMPSNSVAKHKSDVSLKHSSSEWLFDKTENRTFPTESLCPNNSETNGILQSQLNVEAEEKVADCAQDQMESSKNSVKTATGHSPSSTFKMGTTTSKTAEDTQYHGGCEDQKENVERDLSQGQFSENCGLENLNGDGLKKHPHVNKKDQITSTAPNVMTKFDNEQNHFGKFMREELKESVNQENVELDNSGSTSGQDGNDKDDKQDKSEGGERKDSSSLENKNLDSPNPNSTDNLNKNMNDDQYNQSEKWEGTDQGSLQNESFDKQKSSNPISTDGQEECMNEENRDESEALKGERKEPCLSDHDNFERQKSPNPNPTVAQDDNIKKDCQEKDNQSNSSQPSDPLVLMLSNCEDATNELTQFPSNLRSIRHDVESCLPLSEYQSDKSVTHDICQSSAVMSDLLNDTNTKNELHVASQQESCRLINGSNTDVNSYLEKKTTSRAEKTNTTSSPEPGCNGPGITINSLSNDNSDKDKQEITIHVDSCLQPYSSRTNAVPCLDKDISIPPEKKTLIDQSPMVLEPEILSEDVAENAWESFEELGTSAEEPSVHGMLFGEPLSREDSSCDTDETEVAQVKSSLQMRKCLHPVVILKTLEPLNGMCNLYQCAGCQHTSHNVDQLIDHHHSFHSLSNFKFCKTCNLYLMSNEQAEKHLCGITKLRPQLPTDSRRQKKIKRHSRNRCIKCDLRFPKYYLFVQHMRTHTGKTPYKCNGCGVYFSQGGSLQRHKRIPGRCKQSKLSVTDSIAAISDNKTPLRKDLVVNEPSVKLPECYVKLVDISTVNQSTFCDESFSTTEGAKKHFSDVHKGKTVLPMVGEKSKKIENETIGSNKCPLCPRLFKYSYNRARHLRHCVRDSVFGGKEKVDGRYRCPLCHATFTLSSNRYRHINTFCLRNFCNRLAKEGTKLRQKTKPQTTKETEPKTQSKENEQKTFTQENVKRKTAPTATKPEPYYKCNLCPAIYRHQSGKYRHMKKHELFKLTGKMFRYRKSIFSTITKPATFSGTKTEEYKDDLKLTEEKDGNVALCCRFCGKSFSTAQSLKKHELNHRGVRPYRCLECGRGFKKRVHLMGHKIVHQRGIQCTVCKKNLPTIKDLIQHRNTHLNRGMLQCPDCSLKFQFPAQLLRHLEKHKKVEERPQLKPLLNLDSVKEQSRPKQLQCSLCKEVFSDAHVLRKHCLTHISGPSPNQCPFCKMSFNTRRYLLCHMIKHTGDKALSCTNCGKQFYRDAYLTLHSKHCVPAQTKSLVAMESATKTKRMHQCFYCPRVFNKKIRLKNHLRGHKTNSLLLCSKCGQYFGFTKLKYHQKNCEGTGLDNGSSSPSGDLGKDTPQTSQNVKTMTLQSNATNRVMFKCPHCPRSFRFRSVLLRHLTSHTGLQPYACAHCGHRYRSRTMCLNHEAFCVSDNERQSKVKSNEAKQFSIMPTLRKAAQKTQAEGVAEYKCKFCTKSFMKPRYLRRHILTHNEVNPYKCKTCDDCFSRYDHLKVHQARCNGRRSRLQVCIPKVTLDDVGRGWQIKFGIEPAKKEDKFECEVCSKSFSTQSELSRHNSMFHVAKLFKCAECGSSFSHETSLKNHRKLKRCKKLSKETNDVEPMGTNPPTENVAKSLDGVRRRILQRIKPHFNEKYKFTCSYCPRAFGSSHHLNVHTRLHTGERPFACNYCGLKFIRKDYVQRHFQKCTQKTLRNKVLCDRCGGFFPQIKLEKHKRSCSSTLKLSKSTVPQSQQSTSESPPKGFSCAYCSSRFLLFSQLQEHFTNAHKMETLGPPVSTAPLQYHLSNIANIKEEPLEKSCDERLSVGAKLICKLDAALDREDPKTFSCPECNLSFLSKAGLSGHLRVHTKEHPFNCKTCKKGFWNKSLLRNHYRKCRHERVSDGTITNQAEVPLKAEIDFVLNDSVLVFKDGSKTTGTGVLQTNFSCKEDSLDGSPQNSEGNEVQGSSSKEKKAVQYQCSECDKSFTDGLMLISHLEDHGREEQDKKRNTCTKCGRLCASQGHLERHMKLHGINNKYCCSACPKVFYTSNDLEAHRTCHDQNRPYACRLCNQRFWTPPSLGNHYTEDHPDDTFACCFCNKRYSVKKSLARHYRKWHQKEQKELGSIEHEKRSTEKQSSSQVRTTGESDEDENNSSEDTDSAPYFPCHVCGKTFPTSESLEDHQRCHLGEKPHECAECGRCFFQASQLQQHQRMHKSEFQCQACGRGFVSLFALRKHKHTHGKSRPYRCPKCHFSFTGPTQLAEHMSTHREENFPCDICNRVFLSKSSRAEHRKSHSKSGDPHSVSRKGHKNLASLSESSLGLTKELKYRCGVCSERFGDPENLSEHGCMAAKERPYSCSDCDKHFLHASHLEKHRATHKLPWSSCKYPCNQCNNSFSSSQHFLGHLNSHVDTAMAIKTEDGGSAQGFLCPVCHQWFASATGLIDHFPTHPDVKFECKICKLTFSSQHALEEHKSHHLTSANQFEFTECGQSFLGSDSFGEHHCTGQRQAEIENKHSHTPIKTSPPSYHQAPQEEEDVDVTGEDLYNCPTCSMQFSSKSGLLEHQNKQHPHEKTHVKPFKCKLCEKTFALRRYLREHERRHSLKSATQNTTRSIENAYKCTRCHSQFNTAQELSSHMRLHAEQEGGEYRCDMCYKSFRERSLLKQHQESHVGQIVYECNECDKAFAFPHLLEEHQQAHAECSQ